MSPRVLVTNVEERASLAACRGLAAAGYEVIGAASCTPAAGLRSRACAHRLVVPDPRVDGPGFVTAVDEAYRTLGADAFLPGIDAALLALREHPRQLPLHAAPGAPPVDSLPACLDKLALADAGAAAGLPSPASLDCSSPDEILAAGREIGFPVLVKPRASLVGPRGERRQQTARRADDVAQLLRAASTVGFPCLVQRLVAGGSVYSFGGVYADGALLGSCFARYRRTWPAAAGSAACSETLAVPAGLPEQVIQIVSRLGWEGVFELEFVGGDGPLHTIDFNPRLYGSLALAVAAGANLPALWCDRLLGRPVRPAVARPGYRYRWEEAELRFLLSRLARGRLVEAAPVLRPAPSHRPCRVPRGRSAAARRRRAPDAAPCALQGPEPTRWKPRPSTRPRCQGDQMTETLEHPVAQSIRVAVVVPCFNDGATLPETIRSVQAQEPAELVVVDDGSNDPATLESCRARGGGSHGRTTGEPGPRRGADGRRARDLGAVRLRARCGRRAAPGSSGRSRRLARRSARGRGRLGRHALLRRRRAAGRDGSRDRPLADHLRQRPAGRVALPP